MDEEKYAQSIRDVARILKDAEIGVATTEADLKRVTAKVMVTAELEGNKTTAAQTRCADESDEVYAARVSHGIAKGELAWAKAEFKAREIAFETWRTKMASLRLERKAYGA